MQKGRFISFEGPDGSGKTSNVEIMRETLLSRGYTNIITTREPGGTPLGEKIRALLLNDSMCSMTELLLFAAARAEHIDSRIKPHMANGGIVICDRFADSSYAYQGTARDLLTTVLTLQNLVHKDFEPDYTLFFDVTLPESERRMTTRGDKNRLDKEVLEFKRKVYSGYQECFRLNPHRMHRIDAMPNPTDVKNSVICWVDEVFIPNNPQ